MTPPAEQGAIWTDRAKALMRDEDGDEAMPFVCMDCFALLFEQRDGAPRRWKLVLA